MKLHSHRFVWAPLALTLSLGACEFTPATQESTWDLQGSWSTACISNTNDSQQFSIEFTPVNNSFHYTATQYSDRYCQQAFATLDQTGIAIIPTPDTTNPSPDAVPGNSYRELKLRYSQSTLTPADASAVAYFNLGSGICGLQAWAQDSSQLVDGKNCGGDFGTLPNKGYESTQVFYVNESSNGVVNDKTLYFGANSESRLQLAPLSDLPTTLDSSRPFHLQSNTTTP
jgi:hypothetical protein